MTCIDEIKKKLKCINEIKKLVAYYPKIKCQLSGTDQNKKYFKFNGTEGVTYLFASNFHCILTYSNYFPRNILQSIISI